MGLRKSLLGKNVYFDANVIIYLVESPPPLETALGLLRDLIAAKDLRAWTSELTLCEVLTKPLRNRDENAVRVCRMLLEESGAFELVATSRETYVRAAALRAELGLKTPDAVHVATALEADCSIFLSNDIRIRLPDGLERVPLS